MKILICDDEQPHRRIVELTLAARGHTVHQAESADDAMQLFDAAMQQGEPYDLVITDIEMPGQSGYALLGHVLGYKEYSGRMAILSARPMEPANVAASGAEFWQKPDAMRADKLVDLVEGQAGRRDEL